MSIRYPLALIAGLCFWTWLAIPVCGCSTRTGAYAAAIRSDLKNLASQQEIFFADSFGYSDDPEELSFVSSLDVVVTIESFGDTAWAARAAHPALIGEEGELQDCVMYWGAVSDLPRTTMRRRTPRAPGVLACDYERSRSLRARMQQAVFSLLP